MEIAVVLVILFAIVAYGSVLRASDPPVKQVPEGEPELPNLVTAAAPSRGMVSFDGLVRLYLDDTVAFRPRADDSLPFDQPLAPEAPTPNCVQLSDVVAQLPTFPVASRPPAG